MTNDFNIGDVVKIAPEATYFPNKQIAPWVKNKYWKIKSISGSRIVLGKSADDAYTLNAPVDAKYLTKI